VRCTCSFSRRSAITFGEFLNNTMEPGNEKPSFNNGYNFFHPYHIIPYNNNNNNNNNSQHCLQYDITCSGGTRNRQQAAAAATSARSGVTYFIKLAEIMKPLFGCSVHTTCTNLLFGQQVVSYQQCEVVSDSKQASNRVHGSKPSRCRCRCG
jgi:hypothetical protein